MQVKFLQYAERAYKLILKNQKMRKKLDIESSRKFTEKYKWPINI